MLGNSQSGWDRSQLSLEVLPDQGQRSTAAILQNMCTLRVCVRVCCVCVCVCACVCVHMHVCMCTLFSSMCIGMTVRVCVDGILTWYCMGMLSLRKRLVSTRSQTAIAKWSYVQLELAPPSRPPRSLKEVNSCMSQNGSLLRLYCKELQEL